MPSSRHRVYQYLPYLKPLGIEPTVMPAVPEPFFSRLYSSKSKWLKLILHIAEVLGTFWRAFQSRKYDLVFVQKGISLTNFRGLDRFLLWTNPRLVFDADDAVYNTNIMEFGAPLLRLFQDRNQTARLSAVSRAVIVGNSCLQESASQYNKNVYVLPTPVDTDRYVPVEKKTAKEDHEIVVGWLARATGLVYFPVVRDALREITRLLGVRVRHVTKWEEARYPVGEVEIEKVEWSFETEVYELNRFDIGIAPLYDEPWARGKCSMKLLQYMAVGLPTVSSRVGMNIEIVDDGKDGFLATGTHEWVEKLSVLVKDPALRKRMGQAAREKVVKQYSLKKLSPILATILREVSRS